jgi:serine/threonine-protein kinase
MTPSFNPDATPAPPTLDTTPLAGATRPSVRLRPPSDEPGPGPPAAGGEPAGEAGRLRLEGVVGRGGMGVVYRAADDALGRSVAVKVLRTEHRGRPDLELRFLEEAQLTGQLQHPGVPPVHDLGRLPDGRPFFVMKLVRGRTLEELLAGRPDPSHEREDYLAVFEQVCQAVAYAHSHGVVHRDLKPANVMVGRFREVQVMDWGLAKVLDAPSDGPPGVGSAGASTLFDPLGGEGPRPTDFGTVLGTPAYMPPEQARGEVDRLDERCDVFGLGALLCVVLTGQPPFAGDSGEALRQSRFADLSGASARLDGCGADAELVDLARRCLAPDPAARPRDGDAVAAAVAAYRAGVRERLRRAEVEAAAATARAEEERKRRQLVAAGAVAAVLLLAAAGAGLAGWLQRRAEVRQAAAAAAADLDEAEWARDAGRWADARLALERAAGRLPGGGPDPLPRRAERVRADLDLVLAAENAREAAVVPTPEGKYDRRARLEATRAAFAAYGLVPGQTDTAAAAARLRESAVRGAALAALADWEWLTQDTAERDWLAAVLTAAADAGTAAFDAEWRAAAGRRDVRGLLRLAADPGLPGRAPADLNRLALALEELGASRAAARLLRAGLARHPGDFWLHHDLGLVEQGTRPPRTEEAVLHFTAAVALRPDSPAARNNVAVALRDHGRLAEAETELREAVRLRPADPEAHSNLGVVLRALGRPREAEAEYREALRLRPDYADAHSNLGVLLRARGEHGEAAAHFREALRLRPDYPEARNNLGNALRALGRPGEAAAEYGEAIRLRPDFPEAHFNLGNALADQGRFAEAAAELRRGDELGSRNPAWTHPSAARVRQVERLAELDAKLPALVRARARPPAGEALELAELCQLPCRKLFAAAARFAADAFAADPRRAEDLVRASRYNAACAAALAGCEKGNDAAGLGDQERARLRAQARDWLAADLAAWRVRLASGNPEDRALVRAQMEHWQKDGDFAGVRGDEALAKLPEAERAAWRKLWADVDALRTQAEKK